MIWFNLKKIPLDFWRHKQKLEATFAAFLSRHDDAFSSLAKVINQSCCFFSLHCLSSHLVSGSIRKSFGFSSGFLDTLMAFVPRQSSAEHCLVFKQQLTLLIGVGGARNCLTRNMAAANKCNWYESQEVLFKHVWLFFPQSHLNPFMDHLKGQDPSFIHSEHQSFSPL